MSFELQPGEKETIVQISIVDDDVVEQLQEQFSVSLSLQSQLGLSLGNISEATVTIVDDDGK